MWGFGLTRFVRAALTVFLGACVGWIAYAAPSDDEGEGEPRPAVEKEVPLPAFPANESLISVYAGVTSTNRFLLDKSSISIGEDGIVRFVLVTRSASGVENVSFEGIRCDSLERRIYAVGRSDRTWSKSRNPNWMAISSSTVSLPHWDLAKRYFCDYGLPVSSPRHVIDAIRRGSQPGWLGS